MCITLTGGLGYSQSVGNIHEHPTVPFSTYYFFKTFVQMNDTGECSETEVHSQTQGIFTNVPSLPGTGTIHEYPILL